MSLLFSACSFSLCTDFISSQPPPLLIFIAFQIDSFNGVPVPIVHSVPVCLILSCEKRPTNASHIGEDLL